jgi:hypothetical protein
MREVLEEEQRPRDGLMAMAVVTMVTMVSVVVVVVVVSRIGHVDVHVFSAGAEDGWYEET